jgi:hypothetical protein
MIGNLFYFTTVIGTLFFSLPTVGASALWPGEENQAAAGYPAVVKFVKGDIDKPLVVFIPEAHHSARIAYGHETSQKQDFLEFWFHEKGYNFLAISYPIETKSGLMNNAYPDFNIQAWGMQAAEIANKIIKSNAINGRIILLGWSMAGRVAQPFSATAKDLGIDLDFYVSLAATPPITGIVSMNTKIAMAPSGMADRSKDLPRWYAQIKANESLNGNREIIPWSIFEKEYTGNIPVQLQGYGLRYKKGEKEFVTDYWEEMQDAKPYDYENFPLVTIIMPTKAVDARHAMTDTSAWAVYITNKITQSYCKGFDLEKLSESKFRSLADITRNAPHRLSLEVVGNHFFFVGEPGARNTVVQVVNLEQRVRALKAEISAILGAEIK